MEPSSSIRDRSSATTRGGSPPTVTPCHSATGRAKSQFSAAPPVRTSRTPISAAMSSLSFDLAQADGTHSKPTSRLRLRALLARAGGIQPTRSLPSTSRTASSARRPSAGGKIPVSRLSCRRSDTSRSSFASSVGSRPFSSIPGNSTATTRFGLPPTVTPCQASTGVSTLQSSSASPANRSRTSRSTLQSANSFASPSTGGRQSRPSGGAFLSSPATDASPAPGRRTARPSCAANAAGTAPSSALPSSASACRCESFPSSGGMGPVRRFRRR